MRSAEEFYKFVDTAVGHIGERLAIFADEFRDYRQATGRPLRVLDIGCGRTALLSQVVDPRDTYCGCDIAPLDDGIDLPGFKVVDLNRQSLAEAFAGDPFDFVFCGEVIEHLFSPDALVEDLKRMTHETSVLVLSTPNLGYWLNRVIMLFGISPMFLENSSEAKLGRRFRWLGQGNEITEGHIRLFTYRAMKDFLELHGMELLRTHSVPVWDFAPDRLISKVSPSLSPDNIYVIRKKRGG